MSHRSRRARRGLQATGLAAIVGVGVCLGTACRDTREERGPIGRATPVPEASLTPSEPGWKAHDIEGVKFSAPKDARVSTETPLERTAIEIESQGLSLRIYSGPSCVSSDRPLGAVRQEELVLSEVRGDIWVWRGDQPKLPIETEARVRLSRDACVSARGSGRDEPAYADMKRIIESVVVRDASR